MEYRTLIVVDGANNLIECHLNLTDYSMRAGDSNATEKFVDLQLEEHENRRLELVIQDILKSRQGNWCGDMLASRYAQKGIVAQPDEKLNLPPLEDEAQATPPVVTGAVWDHNTLNFEFGRRAHSENSLNAGEIPILSCPFVTALRKLDDMTTDEKQKVLDVIDLQNRMPFRFPQGDLGFDFISRRPSSKELIASYTMPVPDSPLTHGWASKAKHERSKLTMSINGEDEPDIKNDAAHDGCAYGNGNLTCPRPKKRSQIYCGHHLRLVSHKHQKGRALKRSRSSVDLADHQDPNYEGL